MRIWNTDRTQVDITASMHQTLTGLEYGLLSYWSFDECAGGRIRDTMGHHDGQLHGGLWEHNDQLVVETNEAIRNCRVCNLKQTKHSHNARGLLYK